MKSYPRTIAQTAVIARAALILAAMATLSMAHPALAQDTLAPEASANAESPDALPINVQGSWSGTITDDSVGAGTIALAIKQKNGKLSGGWTLTFKTSTTSPQYVGGIENGSRSSSDQVTLKLGSSAFQKGNCRIQFESMTASGTQIQGNYKWADCGQQFKGDGGGTINITPTTTD